MFHSFPDTATENSKDLMLHFVGFSHFNTGLFETVFSCLYTHPSVVVSAASYEI
jgi:hypothetical protein